jgi:uncharacterized membrane protein YbhN (UPF0104 family)/tRNA A-37 threonylcarbamoyl transferase component Bud32
VIRDREEQAGGDSAGEAHPPAPVGHDRDRASGTAPTGSPDDTVNAAGAEDPASAENADATESAHPANSDADADPTSSNADAGPTSSNAEEAGADAHGTDDAHPGDAEDNAGPDADPAPDPDPGPDPGPGARGGARRCPDPDHDPVSGDEPLLPARVHRPVDLVRFLLGLLGIALVLGVAAIAHATTSGVEQDISSGARLSPSALTGFAGLTASIAVLTVPVAFAVERLIKRDGLRIADGVLAAVLAHGVSLCADLWVSDAAPDAVREALTRSAPGGGVTDPVHGYLAPVIAFMTAVGMARRPRWRVAAWCVLLLDAFAVLVGGYTTPFSILVTVLIGWTVAYGTLYGVGFPNVRPTGQNLLAGLRRVGFAPLTARRLLPEEPGPRGATRDASDPAGADRARRYLVTLEDGPPLDVTVVDREQQAQGFFYRVWRRLQLRGLTQRRSLQTLRQTLEQEALLAYAAAAAGAATPRLIATSELGPDAVMMVYEHIDGRTVDSLPDERLTDGLLRDAWRQVRRLQLRRIAHRRLAGDALLVDGAGTLYLTDLRGGEIAAGDLLLRVDVAQLLTTLALRVGPERSVAAAVSVLGPEAVAEALPLLQPIALSRTTRATLKQLARERDRREREAVLAAAAERAERAAAVHAAAEARATGAPDRAALPAEESGATRVGAPYGPREAPTPYGTAGAPDARPAQAPYAESGEPGEAAADVNANTGTGTRAGATADAAPGADRADHPDPATPPSAAPSAPPGATLDATSERSVARARRRAEKAEKKALAEALEDAREEAREEDLLSRIRAEVLRVRPQAPVEPVRLERIKARTLVTFIAGAIAVYYLLSQISRVPITQAFEDVNWFWATAALLCSALTYVAAAASLAGFVPERLSAGRTLAAQVAGSFVQLVAPAAIGGVALNTRYLQKSGVRPGLAVASVGASQLVGLGSHLLLLLAFGYVTGTERTPSLSPSRTVMGGLLAAGVLALVATAVPPLRKFISTRLRALFAGVVPRMLDVLQRPGKLATGIGGALTLTLAYALCLDASCRAFGGHLAYANVAVVFLAGSAIGSAVPTPGGVGAVEAALTAGLVLAGLPNEVATPAVLLYRLVTFWLPVLPGWAAFSQLTRRGAL